MCCGRTLIETFEDEDSRNLRKEKPWAPLYRESPGPECPYNRRFPPLLSIIFRLKSLQENQRSVLTGSLTVMKFPVTV